jgi:uncharacterized membrane protein required for colicin V production
MFLTKVFLHGPVKSLDRILGVGFGGLRAAAVVVLLMWVVRAMGMDEGEWWNNSSFLPRFEPALDFFEEQLPQSLQRDAGADPSAETELLKGVIKQNLPDDVLPSLENAKENISDQNGSE